MKLKKSCYDPAFCRAGLKRFAPLGILYTLALVLLTLANVNMGKTLNSNAVYGIYELFQWSAVLNLAYALVLVELLLGDLYTPRLCYAIHSLPVTRGGWFGTQVIHGLLSVIPGILISGGLMSASVTRFRVLIPLWMGVTLLSYLFFFGLALLCGVCAGNRMGLALLYGLSNFFGVVISWARLKIFAPLIYGMYIPDTDVILCPLSKMLSKETFSWIPLPRYSYVPMDGPIAFFDSSEIHHIEIHSDAIWTQVFFAALGILAIFCAMKLLNRRKPECAGDLLAFRKTEPVVLVLCTLSAGAVFHAMCSLFYWDIGYLMMAIGLVLGYYVCLMLLKRQVNVFTGRNFLPLGVMGGLVFLALTVTGLDLFGMTYRLPEADQIQQVTLRVPHGYYDTFTATEAADIENVLTLHRDALEEHRQQEAARPLPERIFGNEETPVTYTKADGSHERSGQMFIIYTLKNGSTLCRSYQYHETVPHLDILRDIYSQPKFVFSGYDLDIHSEGDLRALLEQVELVQLNCWHGSESKSYSRDKSANITSREEWESLLDALLADGAEGNLAQAFALHPGEEYMDYLNFLYPSPYYDGMECLSINLYTDCEHTLTWLVAHGYHDELPD